MLIDTHAHLDFDAFDDDRGEVLDRAKKAGVGAVINPGCDVASSLRAVELARDFGMVHAAAGIHPNNTGDAAPGDVFEIARIAGDDCVVAIGEIGLDYYRDRSPRDVQVRAFRGQLELARELDLPVIIHFREVEHEGIGETGGEYFEDGRGVFHCFGGSPAFAEYLVERGWHIGFDGPLTFKNSDRGDVARVVPLERCLIETDAPFLAPVPYRGKRNEPAYVAEVTRALAEAKGLDPAEVAGATAKNAETLFGITGR